MVVYVHGTIVEHREAIALGVDRLPDGKWMAAIPGGSGQSGDLRGWRSVGCPLDEEILLSLRGIAI